MEHGDRILKTPGAMLHHCGYVGTFLNQIGIFLRDAVQLGHRTG